MQVSRQLRFMGTLALLLAGCGPQYQTFTTYAPPADAAGRQCLAECAGIRQVCRQDANGVVRQCRLDAEAAAQREHLQRLAEYGVELYHFHEGLIEQPPAKPGSPSPNYRVCHHQAGRIENQCTGDYDLCYQNCGGQITYTTQCVANCE